MSALHSLLTVPLDELRTHRLPELFQCIDLAEEADVPLLTALVNRVFEGADGLAVLRQAQVQQAIRDSALAHDDPSVRCFALMLCRRLASTPLDVRVLCESGVMPAVAGLVSEAELAVAEKAAQVIMACAKAPDVLKTVLDHPPTLQRLLAPCATVGGAGISTAGLRTLAVFAEAAAAGEEQYALCEACGALAPALAAWNSSDELVRLNALEVFALLARRTRGMAWLTASGVVDGMLASTRAAGADTGGALAALHLPAVLHCLAELLEHNDHDQAALALLGADGSLLRSLWPKIEPAAGHGDGVREATLSLVRAAGCSRAGLVHVLAQVAEQGEHAGLRKQLRASNERAKVGALGVVAQLCISSARCETLTPAPRARAPGPAGVGIGFFRPSVRMEHAGGCWLAFGGWPARRVFPSTPWMCNPRNPRGLAAPATRPARCQPASQPRLCPPLPSRHPLQVRGGPGRHTRPANASLSSGLCLAQ